MSVLICSVILTTLCSSHAVVQQAADGAVPRLFVDVTQGLHASFGGERLLLRGAPLEFAVTAVSAAGVAAHDKHVEQLRHDRSEAAAAGKPFDVRPFELKATDRVMLPITPGGWVRHLSVEVLAVDPLSEATAPVSVGRDVFDPMLAEASAGSDPPRDVGIHPVTVHVFMPPDVMGRLPDGKYVLRAALNTANVSEADGVWRGSVQFETPVFDLRDPTSVTESLNVEYHLASYCLSLGKKAEALEHFETILALDETFRNYEAHAAAGNIRAELKDPVGALAAWTTFLSKVDPARDDRLVHSIRTKLAATKASLPK